MKLQKYEQSCFVLETKDGFRLVMDLGAMSPIERAEEILSDSAGVDAILVSHIHGDHFSMPHIEVLNPKTVYLNEECIKELGEEDGDFAVKKVQAGDTVEVS